MCEYSWEKIDVDHLKDLKGYITMEWCFFILLWRQNQSCNSEILASAITLRPKNLCKVFNVRFVNYVSSLKLFTFDWELMIEGRLRNQFSYHKMLNSDTNGNAYDYDAENENYDDDDNNNFGLFLAISYHQTIMEK